MRGELGYRTALEVCSTRAGSFPAEAWPEASSMHGVTLLSLTLCSPRETIGCRFERVR